MYIELNDEQKQALNIVEARILSQRLIEILDDLNLKNHPTKNQKLNQNLKGLYPILDKQTKQYDELFKTSQEGTLTYYETVCINSQLILSYNLIDKNLLNKCFLANAKNEKAFHGILNKILKE